MFSRMIDAICDRIRRAVFERLSDECHAADGHGVLQVDVPPSLPSPEKKRRG